MYLRAVSFWILTTIKRKPTSVKNPQANAILERIHAVVMSMLRTAELDMADSVKPSDIDVFLSDVAWAIRPTYHTVLKASPGAAIFGRDMLFDIPFIADCVISRFTMVLAGSLSHLKMARLAKS